MNVKNNVNEDIEVLEKKLENANDSEERREIIAREISLTKARA